MRKLCVLSFYLCLTSVGRLLLTLVCLCEAALLAVSEKLERDCLVRQAAKVEEHLL